PQLLHAPTFVPVAWNVIVFEPLVPGVPVTLSSVPLDGSVPPPLKYVFPPRLPKRFSAPTLRKPPSPLPWIVPYAYEMSSRGFASLLRPIQISNEASLGRLNSRTAAQSSTIHESEPSVRMVIRIAPAAPGLRSVQKGARTLFGRVGFGKFWLL